MSRLLLLVLLTLSAFTVSAQQGNCVEGNCLNGKGTFRFTDGSTYRGGFHKAKFTGMGILSYANGEKYVGNWRNSLYEGKGRLTNPDGTVYFGFYHQGKRHGEGTITWTNGNALSGKWAFDRIHGNGTFTFANGDRYVGGMYETMIAGQGRMEYASGDVYEGQWQDNMRHGEGSMTFADGTTLRGRWVSGEYVTDWASLGYQGTASALADCRQGCNDGPGRYTYPDGTIFTGTIRAGQPNGNGTIRYADGNIYHGQYTNHRQEGLGVMYYTDGEVQGGLWRGGSLYRRLFSATGRPARTITPDYDEAVKVWAVVVGAARYKHMPTLLYTDDDAYQVYSFLRSVEGGALPDEQVKILVDENATQRNIIMTMREVYQRADENDVILFYFSGHGLPGAFLPVDYDGHNHKLEHFELRDVLLTSRAKHKLVIADACHSGSLGGRSQLSGAITARGGGGADAALDAFYSALNNAEASTALLLSSKGEEISLEDGGLRSGIFSHFLIRGMKGEADENNDRLVSIDELFNFVHREVRRYTGNIQTPTLTGTYDGLMPVSVIRRQ